MRKMFGILFLLTIIGMLTACATAMGAPGAPSLAPAPGALDQIDGLLVKLENNQILKWAEVDAAKTLQWVSANGDPAKPLDEIGQFQAAVCPVAVNVATKDFKASIEKIRTALKQLATDDAAAATSDGNPMLIYRATVFKWGAATGNPLVDVRQARADILRRVDVVVSSCRSLIPIQQLDELRGIVTGLGALSIGL